jgi:hypothetical protein
MPTCYLLEEKEKNAQTSLNLTYLIIHFFIRHVCSLSYCKKNSLDVSSKCPAIANFELECLLKKHHLFIMHVLKIILFVSMLGLV